MRIIDWLKSLFFKDEIEDDGFDEARINAAKECMKRGKPISGKMYNDGSFKVEE